MTLWNGVFVRSKSKDWTQWNKKRTCRYELLQDKTNDLALCSAKTGVKTQISLGICLV